MMTCPYCKSEAPPIAAGTRYVCRQCGESFAAGASPTATSPADLRANVSAHRRMRQKRGYASVRTAFRFFIGFALAGFVAGLVFRTRHRETAELPENSRDQSQLIEPLKVPALRFLPADADAVLVLQTARMRGREGLPEKLVGIASEFNIPLEWLDKLPAALATDWPNVLEIAVAAKADKKLFPPQVWLVLHLAQGIDEDKLANVRRGERGKRSLVRFAGPSGLGLVGWKPVEKYFIVALDEADFDALPEKALPNADHLVLGPRIARFCTADMPAWLVADFRRLSPALGAFLKSASPETGRLLDEVDGLVLDLLADPDQASCWIEAKTPERGLEWRTALLKKLADLAGKVRVGGANKLVFLKMDADAKAIRTVIDHIR